MKLWWTKYGPWPCYFAPDRLDNFNHDARPDENMIVFTAKGEPVCGRVVEGATSTWVHQLDEGWELVD